MQNNHISHLQSSIGWVGSISLVAAYALLTFELVEQKGLVFNSMQLIGGLALGYRVWLDRNWSNFALEVFFVLVAVYAVVNYLL